MEAELISVWQLNTSDELSHEESKSSYNEKTNINNSACGEAKQNIDNSDSDSSTIGNSVSANMNYPSLEKDDNCDILVVGGGIAGLLCAYELSVRGHDVTVIEANKVANGTTTKTTAAITSQHGLIYADIYKKYGKAGAKLFFESQQEGIMLFKKLIEENKMDCHFEILDGYFYSQKSDITEMKKEFQVLSDIGANIDFLNTIEQLPIKITGAIKQKEQAQFNPIEFLKQLPKKFKIYENSRVMNIKLDEGIAYTDTAKIKANKIIIATQYPIINKSGILFTKMYQSISYAAAYSGGENINGIFNDDNENGITIRKYRDMLVVGGIDHRCGRKDEENCFGKLDETAKIIAPNCTKITSWLAEDCVTYDHIPLIGTLKKNKKNVYIITGFNKWGMANSIISANIIADMIDKKPNKYEQLFSPQRKYICRNFGSFLIGGVVSVSNLFKSFLTFPIKDIDKLNKCDGGIFVLDGKKKAVYKDNEGKLHVIPARCPHLGCQLTFNREGTSWDCPCHGSRFDIEGNIINEPAVKPVQSSTTLS